jgi:hypothetical protein
MILNEYYNKDTKTLTLPYDFNEELIDLAIRMQIIIFEKNYKNNQYSIFNKSVNSLPNTITHLTFGYSFNQKVDNLPKDLTHLTFGRRFNQ